MVYQNDNTRCLPAERAISLGLVPTTSRLSPSRRTAASRPARLRAVGAGDDRSDSVSRAYEQLRGLIVSGQLSPGARIAERAVAERLGLSRTPVRSALHRLLQEGFVGSYGRGSDQRLVVTPLTQEDGREIMMIVGHLEGLAARMAAELPKGERVRVVRRLRALNRELAQESRKRGRSTRIFDLDQAFHHEYVEDAISPRLRALHDAIKPQVERYSRLYVSSLVDELPTSVREHDVIIRAIAKGDAAAAQRAVETNWRNAGNRLARVIAHMGERGMWSTWDLNGR
jgi:DNA-binding GntR family transcriptional regulator